MEKKHSRSIFAIKILSTIIMLIFLVIIITLLNIYNINTAEFFFLRISFIILSFIYCCYTVYLLWLDKAKADFLVTLILILSIISLPLVYYILVLGRELSKYENIKIGTPDGWLGFIGSLIGSLITIIALKYTIFDNNKNRRDDKVSESIAFLSLESILESNETLGYIGDLFINHTFTISNKSTVPAINLKLNTHKSFIQFTLNKGSQTKEESKEIIFLNQFKEGYNSSIYIPPTTNYEYSLRLYYSDDTIKQIVDLGLAKLDSNDNSKNRNPMDFNFDDFKLVLFFEYNGYFDSSEIFEYKIEAGRYSIFKPQYGAIKMFTTKNEENWTNLFRKDIVQNVKHIK